MRAPIVNLSSMRNIEKYYIEHVYSESYLMEKAGENAAYIIYKNIIKDIDSKILIISGKGNNGGDGLVVGYYLKKLGYNNISIVIYANSYNDLNNTVKEKYNLCIEENIPIEFISEANNILLLLKLTYWDFIVDALLGIGIKGELKKDYKLIIDAINTTKVKDTKIISIDLPSGLEADNTDGNFSIEADYTISMGAFKIANVFKKSYNKNGRLFLANIGVPIEEFYKESIAEVILPEEKFEILDRLPSDIHKYSRGKVLIIGGVLGYTGALILSACSSLAISGSTEVFTLKKSREIIETSCIELLKSYTNHDKDFFIESDFDKIKEKLDDYDSILIGNGMGRYSKDFFLKLILYIVNNIEDKKIIIDGDGLFYLKDYLPLLKDSKNYYIITPHEGEFKRLFDRDVKDMYIEDKIQLLKSISTNYNIYIVLKGYNNFIVYKDKVSVMNFGGPHLAKIGSGDVLAGLISGILSIDKKNKDLFTNVEAGVYLHILAANSAKEILGEFNVKATDIIENLNIYWSRKEE